MRTLCTRTRIKPGAVEEVRAWFHTLNKRVDETMQTLEAESVLIESAFLDKHGDDYYLIYYLKAKDIDMVKEVFNKSNLPIDHYYKECWKKYCEEKVVLGELIDLERI